MKFLVTGGRGVIASLFARRLYAEGHQVTVIDDGKDKRHHANTFTGPTYYDERLEHMHGERLRRLVGESDCVFHAAASTGIPYSSEQPLDDWQRNVDGTIAVLEALRRAPRPTVVLSSVKPYGLAGLTDAGVDESFPLEPDEPYAASKAAQSHICRAYATSYAIPLVVFRCSNLYGPACCHGARHGFATWLSIRAALDWPIEIQGDGSQSRDMLFASDVGEAALLAWENIELIAGNIYNLGGGPENEIAVLEAYEALRQFGSKSPKHYGPGRKHEDQRFVTNTTAYHAATGWTPKVSVMSGLRRVYDWAVDNREILARVYER